jgi:hypothetical protein
MAKKLRAFSLKIPLLHNNFNSKILYQECCRFSLESCSPVHLLPLFSDHDSLPLLHDTLSVSHPPLLPERPLYETSPGMQEKYGEMLIFQTNVWMLISSAFRLAANFRSKVTTIDPLLALQAAAIRASPKSLIGSGHQDRTVLKSTS